MPLIRAENRTGDGAQYVLNSGEDFFVGTGVTVQSNNAAPVYIGSTGAHVVRIDGTVRGYQGALLFDLAAGVSPAYVYVGKTGALSSRLDVVNGYGIALETAGSVVENHGVISAYHAVSLNADGTALVTNLGVMNAAGAVFFRPPAQDATGDVRIFNAGQVSGAYVLDFRGEAGTVSFVNSGVAQGDIHFGTGNNNLYDGSLGLLLPGAGQTGPAKVIAGTGGLTLMPGRAVEIFDLTAAALGTVSLSFAKAPGPVRFAQDQSFAATGPAAGDVFIGPEKIRFLSGSRYGDFLRGNADTNEMKGLSGNDSLEGLGGRDLLSGGAGVDRLFGGDGDDFLLGGLGADRLFGGAGADDFSFRANDFGKEYAGDFIGDFVSADDRLSLDGYDFGVDLPGSGRYASADEFRLTRGHHRAGDSSDRFIYDAKKTELWFDPDGTGRKRAVLILDFQPGATVFADDIFLANLGKG